MKHGRRLNLRKPSIFALLCGLADRQQEGKSAATVFIQPGASRCVVGRFLVFVAILLAVCCNSIAAEFVHAPGGP